MHIRAFARPAAAAALLVASAASAPAQDWNGFYAGAQVGSGYLPDGLDKFVGFDKTWTARSPIRSRPSREPTRSRPASAPARR